MTAIFDYNYYLAHVDDIFKRLGLTEAQWQKKNGNSDNALSPGTTA